MSHLFYEGTVYHKRFIPKKHDFTYPFFLLDINMSDLKSLKNKFFSSKSFGLFTFNAKDHFGSSKDFEENVEQLLKTFDISTPASMRFLTLPRMFNYVFNPISVLVLFNEANKPTEILVEVHNYNGGRIVYPVLLEQTEGTQYKGSVKKDMYVSPFLKRDGVYDFRLDYDNQHLNISITLYEDNEKTLIASLQSKSLVFNSKNSVSIFFRHIFLTFRVVTRTLWQSLKLYIKGLKLNSVTAKDQIRRY
ncbi:MAG: DUF1365 domain-containing protein [uncultured Sulfurovum sp.]|uniref:DUF1365 domain-containing protein n=1 Tax=uncultured Sulfurovum sp. TaxID=269237 RepID=A0A6S6S4G1_9BACT|nr:MAG: DUF1365 domain-containing protein [uncultured Sulfurovum sp.]